MIMQRHPIVMTCAAQQRRAELLAEADRVRRAEWATHDAGSRYRQLPVRLAMAALPIVAA
jgi:hypothetical protein